MSRDGQPALNRTALAQVRTRANSRLSEMAEWERVTMEPATI